MIAENSQPINRSNQAAGSPTYLAFLIVFVMFFFMISFNLALTRE